MLKPYLGLQNGGNRTKNSYFDEFDSKEYLFYDSFVIILSYRFNL